MPRPELRPTLKLYGDSLSSAGANFWIFCASVVIVIMATAEAMAWGYVASFFASGWRWVTAGIAALFVFAIIWIIDSTFMTLDLKRSHYEHALLGRRSSSVGLDRARFWGGIVGRLLLVTGSLYLSAPFLAQLVFREDIDARIQAVNAERLAEQRVLLDRGFDERREQLLGRRGELEEQRIAEAAGKGPSGRYGRGPAVETIELQLADVALQIEEVERERQTALDRFDALEPEQVSDIWGVELVGNGIQSRGRILEEVLAGESYDNAELAVRAFLFFLFMGLLILKIFQPRSVEVYYSEQLQSLYRQYEAGAFDELLPEAERSTGRAPMDALRFEDWCLQTYALQRAEERERRAEAREVQRAEQRIGQLRRLAESTERELAPLATRRAEIRVRLERLDDEIEAARLRLRARESELSAQQESRRAMDENLRQVKLDDAGFGAAMGVRGRLVETLAQIEGEVLELRRSVASLERRRTAEATDLEALERDLGERRSFLEGVEATVRSSRERLAEAVTTTAGEESRGDESREDAAEWRARVIPVALERGAAES